MDDLIKYHVTVESEHGAALGEGWLWADPDAELPELLRLAAELAAGGMALDAGDLDAGHDELYPHPNSPDGRAWRLKTEGLGKADPYTGRMP
jgi:hypothetical protein